MLSPRRMIAATIPPAARTLLFQDARPGSGVPPFVPAAGTRDSPASAVLRLSPTLDTNQGANPSATTEYPLYAWVVASPSRSPLATPAGTGMSLKPDLGSSRTSAHAPRQGMPEQPLCAREPRRYALQPRWLRTSQRPGSSGATTRPLRSTPDRPATRRRGSARGGLRAATSLDRLPTDPVRRQDIHVTVSLLDSHVEHSLAAVPPPPQPPPPAPANRRHPRHSSEEPDHEDKDYYRLLRHAYRHSRDRHRPTEYRHGRAAPRRPLSQYHPARMRRGSCSRACNGTPTAFRLGTQSPCLHERRPCRTPDYRSPRSRSWNLRTRCPNQPAARNPLRNPGHHISPPGELA